MRYFFITSLLFLLFLSPQKARQVAQYTQINKSLFDTINTHWADSVFEQLTPKERIAQLFMVATYTTKDKRNNKLEIKQLIKEYGIGGLIFMQGTPDKQIRYINEYQKTSRIPLLVGMDLERGLGFRLSGTTSFQRNMTLGALAQDSLIYILGREIGWQCKQIGVHVNFAPDIDVNNNEENPVIGVRSFGEDRMNVMRKGYAFARGLQDEGILAVGKHFPGHGDTSIDSHKGLPVLDFSRRRLDSLELFPFKMLIHFGIGGVMTAHLRANAIDSINTASLSRKVVTGLLQKNLGFRGLVFTDALNMGGVANYLAPGEIELAALDAGNDVLLFSEDVPKAMKLIVERAQKDSLFQKKIDRRVKKILRAKYWAGLNIPRTLSDSLIYSRLNNRNASLLQEEIAKQAVTLVKNKDDFIPIKYLDTVKIASVAIGATTKNDFQKQLSKYTKIKHFNLPLHATKEQLKKVQKALEAFNTVIVSKHKNTIRPKTKFGATNTSIQFLKNIKAKNIIFAYFGFPYGVSHYDLSKVKSLLIGYEDDKYSQKALGQAIFGGIAISGNLPVSINRTYPVGWGIETKKVRLGYSMPENEGLNLDSLVQIEKIVRKGIRKRAIPGCQVLVAKNGNVVYSKAFGYHTYQKKTKVKVSDYYDLASLTKVTATLPLIMQEFDKSKITMSTRLDSLHPEFLGTDKANITVEDMLTHETGLPGWIPFYKLLVDDKSYKGELISSRKTSVHRVRVGKKAWLNSRFRLKKGIFSKQGSIVVGENLALKKNLLPLFIDSIKKAIRVKGKRYKYSDLGFILLGEYLKKNKSFVEPLDKIYKRLGAVRLRMQPWKDMPIKNDIVPTAKEYFIRKKLLKGYVHDLNAALLGGVAGHAGLFGSAEDLAKVWAMYLQKGKYGGISYIKPSTVSLFTSRAHPKNSRRGYGFDKPEINSRRKSPFAKNVPSDGFGHSGFTGTMVWADPNNDLIYIFLSNRVYPYDWNNNIYKMNIRTKIQKTIYKAFDTKQKNNAGSFRPIY